MDHSHIVAMIDACLERLRAARRLLSNQKRSAVVDELIRSADARIAPKKKKKARPNISIRKKQRDELTPNLFAEMTETDAPAPAISSHIADVKASPAIQMAPKKEVIAAPRKRLMPRQPATHAPRRKAAVPLSALVGHVPSGPVFIPAAQVPQERTKSRVESATTRKPEAAPLTAELLAQRWIQSAGF